MLAYLEGIPDYLARASGCSHFKSISGSDTGVTCTCIRVDKRFVDAVFYMRKFQW